jgi:hypothetical protein
MVLLDDAAALPGVYFFSGSGLRCLLTTCQVPSRLTQTSVKR